MRLALILHRHPVGAEPDTAALIALMALHAARLDARVGDQGELLLLDGQDRSRWDHGLIAQGLAYLEQASENLAFSRYHLEASIAGVHAVARDVASTDWRALLNLYDVMALHFPSPVVHLNRAVVLARLEGPEKGLSALAVLADVERLQAYHYYHAVAAELCLGVGDLAKAREHLLTAQELATNRLEKELLVRKLAGLG